MDYSSKATSAKKLIDKFGCSMNVVTKAPGEYIPADDFASLEEVTYPTKGVIVNPTMRNSQGQYGKSDKERVILNGSALPDLTTMDFRIEYGDIIMNPENVVAVKPGGVTILYLVDVK